MKIVVAMSGGVDSSAAALLLKQQGHEVIGLSMRLWSYDKEVKHGCCTPDDMRDARRVADKLDIPFYVVTLEDQFKEKVIDPFIDSYLSGETPNPCVRCNTDIKFDVLLKQAEILGADKLATGHYAHIEEENGVYHLIRPLDASRDQTYFLFGLGQHELSKVLFPLAGYTKPEIRELARQAGLTVSDKKDSQEVCFVSDRYETFVEKNKGAKKAVSGPIVSTSGVKLGTHDGIHQYTVGQRKGLGISSALPMYVVSVEKSGKVIVGANDDLFKKQFEIKEMRWASKPLQVGDKILAQVRSRSKAAPATIVYSHEGNVKAEFDEAQRAISPGQAAVFYLGNQVLGGGWIVA